MQKSKEYSVKKDGQTLISPHFKVAEFRCKSGVNEVWINQQTVEILEKVRDEFGGQPVQIVSGYRDKAYNDKCGGAKGSLHLTGDAVDFRINGVETLKICQFIEREILQGKFGGLGNYEGQKFVHIDPRDKKYYWRQVRSGAANITVDTFLEGAVKLPIKITKPMTKHPVVAEVQKKLNQAQIKGKSGKDIVADGIFGEDTAFAVAKWQEAMGLPALGVIDETILDAMHIKY